MARPVSNFIVNLDVEFKAISENEIREWNAGLSFLLKLLREERMLCLQEEKEVEEANRAMGFDKHDSSDEVRVELKPVEDKTKGKRIAKTRGKHIRINRTKNLPRQLSSGSQSG